ncbi:hypothetical protein M407DRAFT_19024 [Tulasnella calospora MUT 4182]|uniref:Reverse transcriptase zinc-binding domain-containing protein n=1 Tax=Tulasnella calospora MUT 4182 TaxID=1051891 RepID=A0A0C3QUA7_9AGAM|nr:hypothetical protein M407DRAFT_19024 [Tulasnella calospora MUT 4182]
MAVVPRGSHVGRSHLFTPPNRRPEDFPSTKVPDTWTLNGAKIASLSHHMMYEWVRTREQRERGTASRGNLDRTKEHLRDAFAIECDDRDVWLGLRKPYIRREISDFLWIMIHGRSQCGTMFSKWGPGWEELQYCDCGAVESMEHILVGCDDAVWRIRLWRRMSDLLRASGMIPEDMCRPPIFEEIMGVGTIKLGNRFATRLWATIISETAFTVWKLRNRKRFDNTRISSRMAADIWRTSLEKRARTDLAAAKLRGPSTAPLDRNRQEAVTAWRSLVSVKGGVVAWNSADYG